MSPQLQYEKNSMRKSHRTTIPLKVYIKNSGYDTLDWSLTGVSVKAVENDLFVVGDIYDSILMLSMKDATISLKVKLKCVYNKDEKYGFEFVDLSSKNRKVLRRYLELHLDGKLEQIDDLIAVYDEPDINSAIVDPVKLNEDEKSKLEKSFLRKSITAILFSLILFTAISALLYQNLIYKFESIGTVYGNYKKVYPKHKGIIEKIYIKNGDKVSKNSVIADLNSDRIIYQIKLLESIKSSKLKEIQLQNSLQKMANSDNSTKYDEILTIKRQIVNDRLKELQNAKIQLKNHLITNNDLQTVKKSYQDAKEKLALYKEQILYRKNSNIPQPKVINIEEIELKILDKKRELEEYRIFSPVDGIVYEITAQVGDRVGEKDPILTLWDHKRPKIISVVSVEEAAKIKRGSEVEIIDSVKGKRYKGIVKLISNTIFDQDIKMTSSKNFNELFVTIEPEDAAKVLPPLSMVKILFKRTFGF